MKDIIKYIVPYLLFLTIGIGASMLEVNIGTTGFSILIGIIAIYYFVLDNPYREYQKQIIILFIGFLIALGLSKTYGFGTWLPASISGGLAIVYFNRFKSRADKHWVDYLKVIGVFAILPALYFDISFIVFPFLLSIYLLDRLIMRRVMNKTTQIITFSFLGLAFLTLIIFAYIKANDAEKARATFEEQKLETVRQQKVAKEEKKRADELAELAHQKAVETMTLKEQLKDCQSK